MLLTLKMEERVRLVKLEKARKLVLPRSLGKAALRTVPDAGLQDCRRIHLWSFVRVTEGTSAHTSLFPGNWKV